MIPAPVRAEIERRLARVEADEGVRVLLAVESGSRAWGFPSPDSDFDVRFVYCRPEPWYFSIDVEARRDVLEYDITDDIDLSGWDLRKALRLLARSNPAIVDWLQSPVEYRRHGRFRDCALGLVGTLYSPAIGIRHYRNAARIHQRGDRTTEEVPLKSCFYALRALLAVRWIERHRAAPPMEFDALLAGLADRPELLAEITALLEKKRGSAERTLAAPLPRIRQFIESELERLEDFTADAGSLAGLEAANDAFRALVREAWAPGGA